ncbi:outer membrane protein [Lutibacter oricola]|uniref:Outer membrane protein n=1 Tax=Lutibacter oricola TaxID=762486 RepID=A0A1H2XLB8_9FLAO|nr:OmpW family outer membrane protein [Lutibacter oricola]SDW93498.1 outer membrane protein [Lutibacter oricola]
MKKLLFSLLVLGLVSVNTFAQETSEDYSKWQIRLRGLVIEPDQKAEVEIIKGNVDVGTQFIPELDFTYFFSKNWAAELILGTTKHDVNTIDSDLTLLGGPSSAEVDLGNVWLLPPTLTLQYHFNGDKAHPYLGAGVNYTMFYNVDAGDVVDVDYENAFGVAMQAGIDFDLNDKWFINADVKYIFLSTDVTVNAGAAILDADVDINPFIAGIGIGRRF